MKRISAVVALFGLIAAAAYAESVMLSGRVVDASGRGVAGAQIGTFWYTPPEREPECAAVADLLQCDEMLTADAGGAFSGSLNVGDPRKIGLMAYDAQRTAGAVVVLSADEAKQHIELRLAPLVTVQGRIGSSSDAVQPTWTNVYVEAVPQLVRVYGCPSDSGRFCLKLPPGRYLARFYGDDVTPDRQMLRLTEGQAPVDLGEVALKPTVIAQHYGKVPPPWNITEARGVTLPFSWDQFRGKWVVVEFWGYWCAPCVHRSIPELMKFYEEHAAQRDHFEILAFHTSHAESLREMDRKLDSIRVRAWDGQALPFPVLLDATNKTIEQWDLQMHPTLVLVDPEGRLVKNGSLAMLREKLKTTPRPAASQPAKP